MNPLNPSPTTHLTLVLDRSGSIGAIRDDIVAGVNRFLAEQARLPGRVRVTLIRFNTETETIWDNIPLAETVPLAPTDLVPQGGTALHDAIGRAIDDTAAQTRDARPSGPPGPVIVAVFTDGQENSSQRFSGEVIARLVQERRERDGWQFLFFGANQDAAREAGRLSIDPASAHGFVASREGTRDAFQALSHSVSKLRHSASEAAETSDAAKNSEAAETSDVSAAGLSSRPAPPADPPTPRNDPSQDRNAPSWNFEI